MPYKEKRLFLNKFVLGGPGLFVTPVVVDLGSGIPALFLSDYLSSSKRTSKV